MKPLLSFLLVVVTRCCTAQVISPEAIASDGNYFSCASGSISWTIGEPVTDSYLGSCSLTKGFQQPKYHSFDAVAEQNSEMNIFFYPNPVTDELSIDLSLLDPGNYVIDLYDMVGSLLKSKSAVVVAGSTKEKISFSNYPGGIYFVKISDISGSQTRTISVNRQK